MFKKSLYICYMKKECTTCCKGYHVAMRKKPTEQYGLVWYEHKCTMCTTRSNYVMKYDLKDK